MFKDNDTSQPAAFTKGNARADALAKAKEEAARKLAELQPLILRAIDIQTHLVATLISRKDDTGIDCELETPSFYVSGGAKRVSITCSCQPRTRCRVKQPVVCRGDCTNVFAGRVEALFAGVLNRVVCLSVPYSANLGCSSYFALPCTRRCLLRCLHLCRMGSSLGAPGTLLVDAAGFCCWLILWPLSDFIGVLFIADFPSAKLCADFEFNVAHSGAARLQG